MLTPSTRGDVCLIKPQAQVRAKISTQLPQQAESLHLLQKADGNATTWLGKAAANLPQHSTDGYPPSQPAQISSAAAPLRYKVYFCAPPHPQASHRPARSDASQPACTKNPQNSTPADLVHKTHSALLCCQTRGGLHCAT